MTGAPERQRLIGRPCLLMGQFISLQYLSYHSLSWIPIQTLDTGRLAHQCGL